MKSSIEWNVRRRSVYVVFDNPLSLPYRIARDLACMTNSRQQRICYRSCNTISIIERHIGNSGINVILDDPLPLADRIADITTYYNRCITNEAQDSILRQIYRISIGVDMEPVDTQNHLTVCGYLDRPARSYSERIRCVRPHEC